MTMVLIVLVVFTAGFVTLWIHDFEKNIGEFHVDIEMLEEMGYVSADKIDAEKFEKEVSLLPIPTLRRLIIIGVKSALHVEMMIDYTRYLEELFEEVPSTEISSQYPSAYQFLVQRKTIEGQEAADTLDELLALQQAKEFPDRIRWWFASIYRAAVAEMYETKMLMPVVTAVFDPSDLEGLIYYDPAVSSLNSRQADV